MGVIERRVSKDEADTFTQAVDAMSRMREEDCPESFHCHRMTINSVPGVEGERYLRSKAPSMEAAIVELERIVEEKGDHVAYAGLKKSSRGARTEVEIWLAQEPAESYDVAVWFQQREGGDRPEREYPDRSRRGHPRQGIGAD